MSPFPRIPRRTVRRTATAAGAVLAATTLLAACAAEAGSSPTTDDASAGTRLTLTYDGGLVVLDGETLTELADLPVDGFTRVNPAGDDVHVFVTTGEGFRLLDTGADGGTPALTDLVVEAEAAGHVVRHAGHTVLFDDGTGRISIFDPQELNDTALPAMETVESEAAHHGVAIELSDGTLLSTLGTEESRSGVRVLDASRSEIARNEECPNVHGEGTLAGEVVVFGCTDGVLVYDDGAFTKLDAPDEYGRTGNAYVSEDSAVMVGDYNANPDAEGYLLTQLAFVDTAAGTLEVVDLPAGASYTWRDVGRDADGGAVVLSSDGSLYRYDEQGALTGTIADVVAPWDGPVEWQDPHPALVVSGDTAYVTEPAASRLHVVDLTTGTVTATAELGVVPNEIALVG